MCPHCHRDAPVVYRGVTSYCTACGNKRLPLLGKSLTHAGQPSKVGGLIARIFGWVVIAGGITLALTLGLLFGAIFPGSIAGMAIGIPIGLLSLVAGIALVLSGNKLKKTGDDRQLETQERALAAYAANRQGIVKPRNAARRLDLNEKAVDELLTKLAKERPDDVALEFDDRGDIYYVFQKYAPARDDAQRFRVDVGEDPVRRTPSDAASEAEREATAEAEAEELRTARSRHVS